MFTRSLRRIFLAFFLLSLVIGALVVGVGIWEARTYTLQAKYLSELGEDLSYSLKPGPSDAIRYPKSGPYDERLGYVRLPEFIRNLQAGNFEVVSQARFSPRLLEVTDFGIFPPYHEKNQAGLSVLACNGDSLFRAQYPEHVYDRFDAIPPVIVQTLLFIENRELLDPEPKQRNPAVEWDRLAQAVVDKGIQVFRPDHDVPGGSTLATQIEKYRHSPDGQTLTPGDKLQQMASASVRGYLDGEDTLQERRRIVRDYLSTVPLAAAPGFGEVNGIGDGLWAWFGLDIDEVNRVLAMPVGAEGSELLSKQGYFYRHVLSLMIAQRRPSAYLISHRKSLETLTDSHLRILSQSGIIAPRLKDAALKSRLRFVGRTPTPERASFTGKKAANAIRARLASILGVERLYDLDRYDLTVKTALHSATQKAVTEELQKIKQPEFAQAAGLIGPRLLSKGDPSKVIYSFTLYELDGAGPKLRVQADNLDQPFDINQGTKLDLGSTAKLRTLVTYLEIIAKLHEKYAGLSAKELRAVPREERDQLTNWALQYLAIAQDKSLAAMLDASLERRYSASPYEQFFTGGGIHTFNNFRKEDNDRILSVKEATYHSVNLVYIRMMRDIVRYYMFQVPGSSAKIIEDPSSPERRAYLIKFADKEGRAFMSRFYKKYRGKNRDAVLETLLSGVRPSPKRLAAIYRYIEPGAEVDEFLQFLKSRVPEFGADKATARKLYEAYSPDKFSLADLGYIAQVHPLELWLVRYLRSHPEAGYEQVIEASTEERIAVYDWLFKTRRKNAQDSRIKSLLEVEAFLEIHKDWKRLGYPFDSLVPSYATSIGSSADRPAALAELMGIIVNDGVRQQPVILEELHFAQGTPYETVLRRKPGQGERVFPKEVAEAVRSVLAGVVEKGTATRLNRALIQKDGSAVPIGGKTGTGDHRYVTYSSSGDIKESRVVNRSATFVFYIGDRFYGTLTAFVPGAQAANYEFTSSLTAQLLKHLLPTLRPMLQGEHDGAGGCPTVARTAPEAPKASATTPSSVPEPGEPDNGERGKAEPALPPTRDGSEPEGGDEKEKSPPGEDGQ